ncbi:nitrilase-related carbon-nitrogen hydrolase [Cytophagaceae bacterium YF14B1]|uniref:Nitrilase-related carbon-nitrogen hydrolase n=1 Tax=Xanthocytophaga flava TaxID=3048013 RepID=A0AAE3QN78_9BACT|nr:nitrilase-related carbon-nitrogen hydrolase [Xanthocytophaga flavus]MDJ1481776.1 nitrilase-related carbon-nitrogen hydrolase [Xanthocytophaga flavus]
MLSVKTPVTRLSFSLPVMVLGTLISGLGWYVSCGLSGEYGWLLWIAPVPVLILSFQTSKGATFLIAFTAYLIGRLSWFSYLESVATLIPAIIFTLLFPLVFACIILISRIIVLQIGSWYTLFAFPVFFTTFEFLFSISSPHGTAGSIAYSQMNILSLIQIASVTGMLGITFFVTCVPSAIAVGWLYHKEKVQFRYILSFLTLLIISVLGLGEFRLISIPRTPKFKAGLVSLDEKYHYEPGRVEASKEIKAVENYVFQIAELARQGAHMIVLPERAINIHTETNVEIFSLLQDAARQNQVGLVIGYTNLVQKPETNAALIIDVTGNLLNQYNKVHLIPGLESQFMPGKDPGIVNFMSNQTGMAICKDLDFTRYIRKYGVAGISVLFVPAWDFTVDDWLHSRMAILRSVENGFSQVRAARKGRLTINDAYGRVTSEANCADGQQALLIGSVSIVRIHTLYSRFGEWFGVLNVLAVIWFISIYMYRRKR